LVFRFNTFSSPQQNLPAKPQTKFSFSKIKWKEGREGKKERGRGREGRREEKSSSGVGRKLSHFPPS
jgi:hypothetical protein